MATRQNQKDYLWELDEYTEQSTAKINRLTGEAWKSLVEHENYRRALIAAHNAALDLANRLQMAISVLDQWSRRS